MSGATTAAEAPSSPQSPNAGRGNRPNQRNRNASQNSPDTRGRGSGTKSTRGARGGKGRGQGRGYRQEDVPSRAPLSSDSTAEGSSGRPPGGGFGVRLTEAASNPQGETPQSQPQRNGAEPGSEESEVCFICASPIEHVSIAPCNHQTCHICSLRLRALYKTRACAHCRVS